MRNSSNNVSGKDLEPEYEPELTTAEVAEILGVSKHTVMRLKRAGVLEYRNASLPGSARPLYRFTLASVRAVRLDYQRDEPKVTRKDERRKMRGTKAPRYIKVDR